MNDFRVWGLSLPEAYHYALKELHDNGSDWYCPDYDTTCRECSMTMVVYNPLREPMISKLFPGGAYDLEKYCLEMLDGIMDFEIAKGNWAYTYHDRIAKQIPFIIEELTRNPYSRRAVIMVRNETDIGSDDPACLQHIQYTIREGKLECQVTFRSNDAFKATFMNAFALIMLQKRIADKLGVEVGTYIHRANNFHVYQRDFPAFEQAVKRIKDAYAVDYSTNNLCFEYVGDWEEQMAAEDEAIYRLVEQLSGSEKNGD